MRCLVFFALVLLSAGPGCLELAPSLPQQTVAEDDPALHDRNGVLQWSGAPFSGYVVKWTAGHLRSRTPYLNGRRHGRAYTFHEDGRFASERLFRAGDREGTHIGWWADGGRQFIYHYEHDLFQGEQLSYYKNGVRAELTLSTSS